MRQSPIHQSCQLPKDGRSIQPIDPGTEFAREAARVERLVADRELVDRVMWAGYAGPDWEKFSRALAEYGLAVLSAWIISGRIFAECQRKGFGAILHRRRAANDDALGLAGETVALSLQFFRSRVLIPGRWDPTRGASLNTYFVGACIRHFPNVYARSDGSRILSHVVANDVGDEQIAEIGDPSPFSRPDRRIELANAVDALEDPVLREVLLDEAEGYTQAQTAARLNKTRWAVEGTMRRFRGKAG